MLYTFNNLCVSATAMILDVTRGNIFCNASSLKQQSVRKHGATYADPSSVTIWLITLLSQHP